MLTISETLVDCSFAVVVISFDDDQISNTESDTS